VRNIDIQAFNIGITLHWGYEEIMNMPEGVRNRYHDLVSEYNEKAADAMKPRKK